MPTHKSHILIATSPCSVFVSGSSYMVQAGDKLTLKPEEAQQILNGPYASRFADQGVVELSAKSLSDQAVASAKGDSSIQVKIPGIEEQLFNARIVQQSDSYTPAAAGAVDNNDLEHEAESEAQSFMSRIAPKSKSRKASKEIEEPQQIEHDITEAELVSTPPILSPLFTGTDTKAEVSVQESIKIPLPEDAHYSTVRQFLLDKETAKDPHLKEYAQAVKDKYPTYRSVVMECARILESSP